MLIKTESRNLANRGTLGRRDFLGASTILSVLAALSRGAPATAGNVEPPRRNRLLFTSQGKTGVVNVDGSGLRYFEFNKPDQATWQPGGAFPDGRRILF